MVNKQYKFDFADILIQPAIFSDIESRSTINIIDGNGMLPIFTAPMLDVVSENNYKEFNKNGIYSIIPRKSDYSNTNLISNDPKLFYSLSLDEFIDFFIIKEQQISKTNKAYILIDIANGHMKKLSEMITISKSVYGSNLVLMCGNVAHPKTYTILSNAGADYIRLGIGNGSSCLTTENTAIGYPLASLIHDTYLESCNLKAPAKIVADGGIKTYSDCIKALALGADMIMLGSIFNKAIESSGECYTGNGTNPTKISQEEAYNFFTTSSNSIPCAPIYKSIRGMSTKNVQSLLGNNTLKTSEGTVGYNKVEYTLAGWVSNFSDYLKSNMSYCGIDDIKKYIGQPEFNLITINAYNRYHK